MMYKLKVAHIVGTVGAVGAIVTVLALTRKRKCHTVEVKLVKPSGEVCKDKVPLTGADVATQNVFSAVTYVFDTELDPEVVATGLARALTAYPELSGRICGNRCVEQIGSCIPFSIVRKLEGWKWTELVTAFQLETEGDALVAEAVPSLKRDQPLIVVRLTLYPNSNRSVLSAQLNHGICDGASIALFLHAWSAGCKGDKPTISSPLRYMVQLDGTCCKESLLSNAPDFMANSRFGSLAAVPKLMVNLFLASPVELRIRDVASFKKSVDKYVGENNWISTFEVIHAALVVLEYELRGRPDNGKMCVAVNADLRLRSFEHFPSTYFGNANMIFVSDLQIDTADLPPLQRIARTALSFHRNLREKLGDTETLSRYHRWYNSAVEMGGILEKLRIKFLPPVFTEKEPYMSLANSWSRFEWFKGVDFGSGHDPELFMSGSGIGMSTCRTIIPRTADANDCAVQFRLGHSEILTLRKLLADWNLPFTLIS